MCRIFKYIEIAFRHIIVYPLLGILLRNRINNTVIDLQSVKKILILRDDGIGDMIVSTPIFRKLKENNPKLFLGVIASIRNYEIIKHNPYVDKIYIIEKNIFKLFKELKQAKNESYNVILNFVFNQTTKEGIIANIISRNGIKVGQGNKKYEIYFNRLLKFDRLEDHMIMILAQYIDNVFGTKIQFESLAPEIFYGDKSKLLVNEFISRHNLRRKQYIVINFSAIDVIRRLSIEQTVHIVNAINHYGIYVPILIYPPNEYEKVQLIYSRLAKNAALVFPESGKATLNEIAYLIEGAQYVVTCDTSIVHFATATKTPVFVLYTPTAALNHEWLPFNIENKCIYANIGLGVDSIPLDKISKELDMFNANITKKSEIK